MSVAKLTRMVRGIAFVCRLAGIPVVTSAGALHAKIQRIIEDLASQVVAEVRKALPFLCDEIAALESVVERWGICPDT